MTLNCILLKWLKWCISCYVNFITIKIIGCWPLIGQRRHSKSARETLMETKVNRAVRELFDLGVLLGSSVPLNIGMNEN